MSILHKTKQVALLSFAAALLIGQAQPAHADGVTLFMPSVRKDYGISAWTPEKTTLDQLKACVKDSKANDACEITNAMTTAWQLIGHKDKVPFKVRDRTQHTDQAIYLAFTSDDDERSCQIGWHVQRDFWYSDCKGPLYGDGGMDTIYPVVDITKSDAHMFTLAIGANAGKDRAGNLITYLINGFWLVDWTGQAKQGFCPIDNPFTGADESKCIR